MDNMLEGYNVPPTIKRYLRDGASGVETAKGVARVVGRAKFPDEKDGDAFPIVEVWLNLHRDRFVTATAAAAL